MFLDETYFRGELYLPNIKFRSDSFGTEAMLQVVGETSLNEYIEIYEAEYLNMLLGDILYYNFITGLDESLVNPIWEELRDKIFVKGKYLNTSPAANYVFFHIQTRGQTHSTMAGEKLPSVDYSHSVKVSPVTVKAYANMFRMTKEVERFLYDNWSMYSDYSDDKYFRSRIKFNLPNEFGI